MGAHPHVIQPGRWITLPGGERGYVAYSLGNFVSGMDRKERQLTVALEIRVTRGPSGESAVSEVIAHPGRMRLKVRPYAVTRLNPEEGEGELLRDILARFER